MGLVVKILNCCCEAILPAFRKTTLDPRSEVFLGPFINSCCTMIHYCKREMEDSNNCLHPKSLLNELIVLLGYMSFEDLTVQKRLMESGLLEEIFNLPVQYIMDSNLREVHIPTFCCLIHDNKAHLNLFLKDNSPQPIIKAIKKELGCHSSITRKASTTSLVSMAHISAEYSSGNYEADRMALELRFPVIFWESLCSELEKYA